MMVTMVPLKVTLAGKVTARILQLFNSHVDVLVQPVEVLPLGQVEISSLVIPALLF